MCSLIPIIMYCKQTLIRYKATFLVYWNTMEGCCVNGCDMRLKQKLVVVKQQLLETVSSQPT